MRKLIIISLLLVSLFAKGQNATYPLYGYLSQRAWLWIPTGWDRQSVVIYLHGAGQRGTDTTLLNNEGPPRFISLGQRPNCAVISPQCPAGIFWPMAAITATINYVRTTLGVNQNRIYLDGYSLGATGVREYITTTPYPIAAAHLLAGNYVITTTGADSTAKISGIKLSHSGGDGTQNISNAITYLDSLLHLNHTLKSLPETNFLYGLSHGASDDAVYANYGSGISKWLQLHHQNIDSTAEFHVDSLENSGVNADWYLLTRAQYIVNALSASAHKTDLLNRIVTIKNVMNGGSNYVRVIMDLGVAAKTSTGNINNMTDGNTGQILSNMIDEDGAATTWDFNIVLRTNTTEESDVGEYRGYWYPDPNAFDDVFSVFSLTTGSWRIQGLDNAKTYTIRMTGGGAVYSAGTQYGLNVTIGAVTKNIPLMYRNTAQYVEFKGVAPSSGNITISPKGMVTNAVAGVGVVEIVEEGTTTAITVAAGNDTMYAYNQDDNTAPFTMTAIASGGTPSTWAWTQVSGPNSATLTNANTATVTVSDETKGYYVFRITVNGTAYDEKTVYIRDYNEAGKTSCRAGGGQSFEIGNTIISGVVSTTFINIPYVNRDNIFGESVLGYDTIKVHQNPNNGGIWNTMVMGGFGGGDGCPVTVMPYDTLPVKYGSNSGYWRLAAAATGDSNFIYNVHINGLAHRDGNRYVYGFQGFFPNYLGLTIVAHNFRHLHVDGVYGLGGPLFMKKDSDSTKLWSLYNNYNPGPLHLHDIHIDSTDGEGTYLGTTDVDGDSFDGPTNKGADSSRIYRMIIQRSGWDGLQFSNYGNGVEMKHIITYKTGWKSQSSQQGMITFGGATQGTIDSTVQVNGTGGPNVFGAGRVDFRWNIIDSVINGGALDYSGLYASQAIWDKPVPPLPDSLVLYTQYNIIKNIELYAINYANTSSRMKNGVISDNIIVDAAGRTNALINDNASSTVTNNTFATTLDLDVSTLAPMIAYRVYKLIRAAPVAAKISFFDAEVPEGGYLYRLTKWPLNRQ